MFSSVLLIAALMIQLLQAQENRVEYINVLVTNPPEGFIHPEIGAGINDVIVWSFIAGENHSVVQSTYDNPCHYKPGGFNSGFVTGGAVGSGETIPAYFLVQINDTNPIYYYSGFPGDCQAGAVGVINYPCSEGNGINSTGSLNVYRSLAEAVTSAGPLPTAIMGGIFLSTSPTGTPTGSPGPPYTGGSASCTGVSNSTSNSNSSSSITSSTTSGPTSSSSPGLQSISTSCNSTGPTLTYSTTSAGTSGPHQVASSSSYPGESASTSPTTSAPISTTSSGLQPILSSSDGSSYGGIIFRNQQLPVVSWLGLVIAVLFAFIIL
ncbi:hypothetical protein L207DRAFT_454467 [Hyaloscypha variabilis F]|uniref:Extracellular serine-rich protein n=1 Tax=Hyaloscypha variabilis (strain UAMH 11265 / GT02V1 / F) TaxID=1149755 RepID=A0A2J6S1W1_HYAVF|nr:hypothetical protein L207DRAFT_454467 [Hyaloscypha variabilis F]